MLKNLSMSECLIYRDMEPERAEILKHAYFGIMSVQRVSLDVVLANISLEMEAR
jgi:hypothetical protein